MSLCVFALFVLDKWRAVQTEGRARKMRHRRIPERTLLSGMWFCGAPGGLLAMMLCRHKTKHASFWLCGVFALLLQLAVAWGIVLLNG